MFKIKENKHINKDMVYVMQEHAKTFLNIIDGRISASSGIDQKTISEDSMRRLANKLKSLDVRTEEPKIIPVTGDNLTQIEFTQFDKKDQMTVLTEDLPYLAVGGLCEGQVIQPEILSLLHDYFGVYTSTCCVDGEWELDEFKLHTKIEYKGGVNDIIVLSVVSSENEYFNFRIHSKTPQYQKYLDVKSSYLNLHF